MIYKISFLYLNLPKLTANLKEYDICKCDLNLQVNLKTLFYSLLLLLQKVGSRVFDKEFILYIDFAYFCYYEQNNRFKCF